MALFLMVVCLILIFGGIAMFLLMQRNINSLLRHHDLNSFAVSSSNGIQIEEIQSKLYRYMNDESNFDKLTQFITDVNLIKSDQQVFQEWKDHYDLEAIYNDPEKR